MNTTYFTNLIMGNVFRTNTSTPIPSAYYIGLSTSAPTIAGVCTGEIKTNGTGYTRIKLDGLSVPNSGLITNNNVLKFPESITAWGIATHYIVYDSLNGGNLLFFGELESSRNIEKDTVIVLKEGALTIQLSNVN